MQDPASAGAVARAQTLEQLALQLGRPEKSLAAFHGLNADQVATLSDALAAALEHQRLSLVSPRSAWLRPLLGPLFRHLRR